MRGYGFDFAPTIDMEAIMQSESGNPRKELTYMKDLLREHGEQMLHPIHTHVQDADLLISGFVSESFVQAVSEKYSIRQINAALQPYLPTRSGAASIAPLIASSQSVLNRWMGQLAERILWSVASETANNLRSKTLHLPIHTAASYTRVKHQIPTIQGFSRYVVPPALDWDKNVFTTGYWFLNEKENWQPSSDLIGFLQAGEAPIYIGFGSMSSSRPEQTVEMIVAALAKTGQRGIISSGWSKSPPINLPGTIMMLDKAPHDWLFPRMAGVVHHGGAGTTAAGLWAGVPTMIIPHMSDQPYWGRRVYELGVGTKPIPRHKLTVDSLAHGIGTLVSDQKIKTEAAVLGEKIRAEKGVENAVEIIESLMR